jgi:uncharacterized cofD-like protein
MHNLLVEGIRKALVATAAIRVFVCNVATQHGETDGFTVADHLEAVERHIGHGMIEAVVANNNVASALPEAWNSTAVTINKTGPAFEGVHLMEADVVAEENRYRHDPAKLAATILRLYYERDSLPSDPGRRHADEAVLTTR